MVENDSIVLSKSELKLLQNFLKKIEESPPTHYLGIPIYQPEVGKLNGDEAKEHR